MNLLVVFFGTVNVERDNWEPRIPKLEKSLALWKSRALFDWMGINSEYSGLK